MLFNAHPFRFFYDSSLDAFLKVPQRANIGVANFLLSAVRISAFIYDV